MIFSCENVTVSDVEFKSGKEGKKDFAVCSLHQVGQSFPLKFVACFDPVVSNLRDGFDYSKVLLSYSLNRGTNGNFLPSWKIEKLIP